MLFDYNLKNYNYRLLIYMIALSVIGILVINSATAPNTAMVVRQIIGVVSGLALAVGLSFIDYRKLVNMYALVYALCFFSLLAVLFFGKKVGGATRWIVVPGLGQLQPSEFAKVGLIVFFSWYLDKYQEKISNWKYLGMALGLLAVPIALILMEPNLSTSLITIATIVAVIFAAEISYKWVLGAIGVLVPTVTLFVYLLQYEMIPFVRGYQARRILAWFYPEKYSDARYQQDNSILAIGSGQLNGKGLNNNTFASVKNGNFLAEEQTDFIFAIIGEELGFIGSAAVILLYLLLIYECLWIAGRAKDMSGRLICIGMAALIAFQAFSNIAVATGIFPNTGLPLPFVSYGVSSLISIFVGMGIVLNVGLQRKNRNN